MPYEVLEAKLRTIPEDYFDEVSQFLDFIVYKSGSHCNAETMEAIEEIRRLKKDPNKRVYRDFSELLEEVTADV